MEEIQAMERFSLQGGPLYRLGQRLGLVRGSTNTVPLGVALGLAPWLILLAMAAFAGVGDRLFVLSAIAGDVRFLVVIPLFFLCETTLDSRMSEFVVTIVQSGVVPSSQLTKLGAEIERTRRWKDAWFPEAFFLFVAVFLFPLLAHLYLSANTAALDSTTRALTDIPLAGWWYWIVCLPLFRFLLLRWAWRLALWCCFLWRLARLDLHLVPTHPDGVGGLGYVEVVQARLIAFVFALSILVSASFAEEISVGKRVFDVIYPALAVTVVAEMAIILLPPFVFAFRLRACQEKGVSDYGVLAARYVRDFEAKWLNAASTPEEPLLGTPDLQSLADLSNSVGIVRNMRRVPVSMRLATSALVAVLAPMAPLFLFKYPFAVIVQQIFKKLAGM